MHTWRVVAEYDVLFGVFIMILNLVDGVYSLTDEILMININEHSSCRQGDISILYISVYIYFFNCKSFYIYIWLIRKGMKRKKAKDVCVNKFTFTSLCTFINHL